jgi:phosphatidylglycerophosphate synthase
MVGALFVREFFVTAARTVYERRGLSLKSSYLARYKTWVQMCGIGVLFLLGAAPPRAMELVLLACAVLPVLFFVLRYALVRKPWKGASFFAVSFATLLVSHRIQGAHATAMLLGYYILGITWASGLGYFFSVGQLKGRGVATAGDVIRLITSVALPCLAIAVQARELAPVWPLITLVSLEMAHGGLDNLLAHHRAEASAAAWGLRLGSECALLAWALAAPGVAPFAALAAFAVGAVGIVVAFVQKRRYYLDPQTKPGAANPLTATV